jgi:Eukaryotic glutathione synthase, ATP binding domain
MIHADPSESSPTPEIKQVEFNTISSSFGGLSSAVTKLHQYILFPLVLNVDTSLQLVPTERTLLFLAKVFPIIPQHKVLPLDSRKLTKPTLSLRQQSYS